MEQQHALILKLFTYCILLVIAMESCASFKKKDNLDSYYLGKETFQKQCNSCHQYKKVTNWIAPSLSEFYSLDSIQLKNKIDK